MSSVKVLKTLGVGKGITMDITVNESEPEGSIDRYAMDTTCTGEENHAEHISIVQGRMEVTINGDKVILKAGDPTVLVPRRVVHSIKGFPDEKLIFRERPDPAGIYKAM
ncbi:hypothetical protein MGN70_014553 [Eutypa lata]|nr:hypothetical protein MGN70_014553 [Eutypa lata]